MTSKQKTFIERTFNIFYLEASKLTVDQASQVISEVKQKWAVTPFPERKAMLNEIKAKYSL